MSHVSATPQALADAAGNLAAIRSTIHTANAAAAAGTAGVKAPGSDSVSAFITALFAVHAQAYQAAGAQAAHYHDQFVQAMHAGAKSYASSEAANASLMDKASGMFNAPSHTSAGHLIGNGANGAMGTGQHGSVGAPLHGNGGTSGPGNGNLGAGGPGADGRAATVGGPPGGNAGGGADGVPAGDGRGSGGSATNGGGVGGGEVADQGGAGGGAGPASGAGARDAAAASVPTALGPAVPVAPVGPLLPGLASAPWVPAVMAGDYPATAGLAGLGGAAVSGDSPAIGGLGEPAAPAVSLAGDSPVAAAPAAESTLATATKAQPVHRGTPVPSGGAGHPAVTHHDKPALPLPLPSLRGLRGLREKLQQRSELRDVREWRTELREAAISKPWGRDELLGALGLRPPGSE